MKIDNIKNFGRKLDESIPDATAESLKDQCMQIGDDAMNTGKCAVATLMCIAGTAICAYRTIEDTAMLGLMISKTSTKRVFNGLKNMYEDTPAMAVVR